MDLSSVTTLVIMEVRMTDGKSWIDDDHYRVTDDDGRRSYVYEFGFFGDTCVEIADHHEDGTTTAYEVGGVLDSIFNDGKGDPK